MTLRFSLTPNAKVLKADAAQKKKTVKRKLPGAGDTLVYPETAQIEPPTVKIDFKSSDYSDYSDDEFINSEDENEIEDEIEDLKSLNHYELKDMYEKELRCYQVNIDKVTAIINQKLTNISK